MEKFHKIAIALAAMFQAAALVRDMAKTGKMDTEAFETCIRSIYKINSTDITDIYGGNLHHLDYGFNTLLHVFAKGRTDKDPDISRYFVSLIYLERKLKHNKHAQNRIYNQIIEAQKKAEYFHPTHDNLIDFLADLYLETISQFRFRIQILGARNHLSPQDNLNKIRALLLAGIRAAVLWRQMGGGRFQIIFCQDKIIKAANELKAEQI